MRFLTFLIFAQAFLPMHSGCSKKETRNDLVVFSGKNSLQILTDGNKRFREDRPLHPDQNAERLKDLEREQHPMAVIISCSDSRVPPELVFDLGLGDLFVIRNAGNIIGDYELGSVEYAVEHLQTPLVIVLGHTSCGAIGAYIDHKHDTIPNHIQSIVEYIKNEPEEGELNENAPNYYAEAIKANVLHGTRRLRSSGPVLSQMVKNNKITIIGGIYDLESGKVSFLKE